MTARLQAQTGRGVRRTPQLVCEELEARETPAVTATLVVSTGVLTVTADASGDRVRIYEDGTNIAVLGNTVVVGEFPSASVTSITVNATGGNNSVIVDNAVLQPTTLTATSGTNKLVAGGGPAMLTGGSGTNELIGGLDSNAFNGGGVNNTLLRVQPSDIVFPNAGNQELVESPIAPPPPSCAFVHERRFGPPLPRCSRICRQ
jgi:Ca2+-binding RTX toxin-like protein